MIEIRELEKSFDKTRALRGVDLNIPTGSVYGLIGPNGAGKSTVIRCLTGIYRPDAGTIRLDGEDVYENPAAKQRMFYIPDELYSFVSASTRDLHDYYAGVYKTFDAGRYDRLRAAFEIGEKKPIRSLSRGMQKQAAFWLALSVRPDILVLDEPVDGLDPVMRRRIWSLILQDVAERNMTVLVSSHNLRELEDVCDHVGVIDRGQMVLEHSLSSLQDNIVKLQIVLPEGKEPEGLNILHESCAGRLRTLVIRGSAEQTRAAAEALKPVFYDILPVSLEEIFIYELGGADLAKSVIL